MILKNAYNNKTGGRDEIAYPGKKLSEGANTWNSGVSMCVCGHPIFLSGPFQHAAEVTHRGSYGG